ncbi:tripeptidyl-peptidase [Aureococcus anophagefferens]|nr:tripeptidyl-peptidase [Aureococcus anophagefferens]
MALRAEAALYVLDPTDWAADLGEDLDWATANAPFVRLPGHPAIERVFYYRWRVVKKHIVPIDGGSVITEFLPRVPWAGAHNTIPAAAGHHIAETAWLADATVATNYSRWYRQANYSCWWQNDDRDAMEVSISGAGCRPTIAAALWRPRRRRDGRARPRNDALVDEFAAYEPGVGRHETSRLLKGLADRLHAGRGTASLTAASYAALLTAYAEQHVNTTAVNDTGVPHVYENVHPFLGYWNNRERMYWTNNTEKDMGVRPLLDPARGPFAVDGVVLLDNRTLSATWDEAAGFAVYVDGVVRNRSDTVVPLWVDLDCMIAATLMVMMPWEAPRRSGYDACVAPEDAALEAALRRSSRRGRATRRIGAGVACVLLLAVASSAARSRDGLRTREMDVVAPEGCGGAARFGVAAVHGRQRRRDDLQDGAAVKLAYYEKGARKEACDTHTIYVELQSDDAGLRAALEAVSSPTSPDFRKFWTPEESKSAFVVGDGDRVEAWLRSFGAETARASSSVRPSSGAGLRLEAAFGCELYRFDAPHRSVDRCDGGYAVHDDIFDEVRAVHGLAELPPVLGRTRRRRPAAARRGRRRHPKTLANYYDVDTALDGAGATQSVFETDLETYSPGDLEAFEAEFDLRRSAVSDVGAHVSDEACAADADACSEANLDVQYITALAPGAERSLVPRETVLDVFVQYAVDLDAAEDTPLVNSISYGSFERENAPDAMEAFNRAVMKLGLAGATVFVSSGDDGAPNGIDDASECAYNPSYPRRRPTS